MLMSIPYNKYTDGTGKLGNELFCINNELNKNLTFNRISKLHKRVLAICDELFEIQISLLKEKETISCSEFEKYQNSIDNAFKYAHKLDQKLKNAKKEMMRLAKQGVLTSCEDSILFTTDDDLLQN